MVRVDHPESRTVGYGWNLDGTTASVTHADGSQRRYTYDSMGNPTAVAVAPTPVGVGVPLAAMAYDADGRLLDEVVHAAGGSGRARTYDDAGRLSTYAQVWDDGDEGWDLTGATLSYRTDGRLGSQDRTPGGAETYDYDPAGQLVEVTGTANPMEITYGPRGNRTSVTTPDGTAAFTYHDDAAVATVSAAGFGTATFSYDAAGRRTDIDIVDDLEDPFGAVVTSYDAAGRTTLVAREVDGSVFSTRRAWDGDGNLTGAVINDDGGWSSVEYLWDTTGGLPRVLDGYLYGVLHARVDLANHYLGLELDLGGTPLVQWYGYDALGSAVDPNDNPTLLDAPDTHDPWGIPTPDVTAHPDGIYRGEHRYGDLVHLRARQYHPDTGQFTTPDPLPGVPGTPTAANPYHYTDNDPLNKTDPTGMRPRDCDLGESQVLDSIEMLYGTPGRFYEAVALEAVSDSRPGNACFLGFNGVNKDCCLIATFGDLANAKNVAVVVDGTGQNISGFWNDSGRKARNLQAAIERIGGGPSAVVAWLGYDSPNSPLQGWQSGPAKEGGHSLTEFIESLRNNGLAGARIAIAGHSYGSVVVGRAMSYGVGANVAVVTGTPGLGMDSIKGTGFHSALYVGCARNDDDVNIISAPHGATPCERHGDFDPAGVRYLDTGSAAGHNEYYTPGGRSLISIAAVVAGKQRRNSVGRWGLS